MRVRQDIEAQSRALAQKLEDESRAVQELEIAKRVQSRLFPQIHPELNTLEYAGVCIQARHVSRVLGLPWISARNGLAW